MKVTVAGKGNEVNLTKNHFVAKGGEGSIYIVGRTVYKICEKGHMIPEGKFRELDVLTHPKIIKPKHILLNSRQKPVGYTMKAVPKNPMPLAKILTKSYRERNNIPLDTMGRLILQARGGIVHIHEKDCLQVDGNEMNYMVTDDCQDIYFIDVNSFETPNYPAEALMLSVRDWHVEKRNGRYIWTEESDWFSFAVISFYMWTGLHPYKGRHPQFSDPKTMMTDMMKANISVLNSETKFPKAAAYPFDVIPNIWMQWYTAVLEEGKRVAPPLDFEAKIVFVAKVKEIAGSNNFAIEELFQFGSDLVGFYSLGQEEVVVTKDDLSVNRQTKGKPASSLRVGFTPVHRTPVSAHIENDLVQLTNLKSGEKIAFTGGGDDLMSCEGRLYARADQRIYEITFIEPKGGNIVAAPKVVTDVQPNVTQLFQGVAVQYLFDGYFVSVFPESGFSHQFHIKELEGYRVLDAKYEGGVLMIVGVKNGQYDRFTLRFKEDWSEYEISFKVEDINFTGINFTVLDNGLCVVLTEEEKIEIFSSRQGSQSVKSIDDPVIESDMRLCHSGSQVMFAQGAKLYKMSMK